MSVACSKKLSQNSGPQATCPRLGSDAAGDDTGSKRLSQNFRPQATCPRPEIGAAGFVTGSKNILLASVGLSGPRKTRYQLDSRTVEAPFSAFGLWQLLDESSRPSEIWFLLTPRARKEQWGAIDEEAKRLNVVVRPVDLLGDMDDTRAFLEQTASSIPQGCRLTLDVTQGLRHHAFLFYALAVYLSAFRNVQIDGVWYCRLETPRPDHPRPDRPPADDRSETQNHDDPKPLIDLKPTLDLAHWFHALAVFREQGATGPIAALIEREVESIRQAAREQGDDKSLFGEAGSLDKYAGAFNRFGFAYSSGLPLELGKVSHWVEANMARFAATTVGTRLPLADAVAELIVEESKRTAFRQPAPSKGKWKSEIELTDEELARQASIIDAYLERRQFALAVGLMREWVVSWLMRHAGETVDWVRHARRKPFEQRLGSLLSLMRSEGSSVSIRIPEEHRPFAEFWSQLTDSLRNSFHHHGMREDSLEEPPKQLGDVISFWKRLKRNEIDPPRVGGGEKKLLLCPIGLTPGVLYSALHHTRPDRVLVICSEASRSKAEEAVERSGQRPQVEYLELHDVHTGIGEFPKLIDEASRWLFEADEIEANLTGGTTLMGVLVNELVKRARGEYQRPVREFVLIDRRTPEEQRSDPWQLGEIRYLDGEPANNGTNRQQGSDASEETN